MVATEAHEPGPGDICGVCKLAREAHKNLHHPFVEEGQDPGAALGKPKKKDEARSTSPVMIMPQPDLVLRQALINKGLITPQDLQEVERGFGIGQAPRVFAEPPANT